MKRSTLSMNRILWFVSVSILVVALSIVVTSRIGAQVGTSGSIQSCKHDRTGVLKVVDEGETCPGGWTSLNWNVQGPAGDTGPAGPQGQSVAARLYTATGDGEVILTSSNSWNEFPNLTQNFTLSEDSLVQVSYQINSVRGTSDSHIVTRLIVDGEEQPAGRAITGNTTYWSPTNVWFGQLTAGSHAVTVEYRTPVGGTNNPGGSDWQSRVLNVLVFSSTQ